MKFPIFALILSFIPALAPAGTGETVIDFENGWEGWSGPQGSGGSTVIEADGGNPGAHAHTVFNDFGITFRTDSNQAFLGDLTGYDEVTVSVDVRVEDISFNGQPAPRDLIVDFRSTSLGQNGYPWSSVYYTLTTMESGDDWATYTVTFDPTATELPAGWGGYGAEDPDTFEPILPPDLTFADIMANTEELAFTTLVPGMFFGFTDHDVRIDNIRIVTGAAGGPVPEARPVPALTALGLVCLVIGTLAVGWRLLGSGPDYS